ncbi:MAG: hypothetical protein IPI60_07955 [Saprospiraceae bacterium]|nr:hypothetical protein [Saprospiraceae bacterium]
MITEKTTPAIIGLMHESALSMNLPIEECRGNRSKNYINWIRTLDETHKIETQESYNFDIVQKEFACSEAGILPKFVLVRCHLGHHDVHLLDITNGNFISHIKKEDFLPAPLQNARILAKNYNYAFVEVYEDKILLVRL